MCSGTISTTGLENWDTTYLDEATAEIVDENLHLVIDDCAQLPAIRP